MSKENKAVVRTLEEAWDAGKLDEVDRLVAPDFNSHAALPGMPQNHEVRTMIHSMSMGAMPDRKVEIQDMIAEGDKVVEHWGVNDALSLLQQTGGWTPPPMPGA